MRRLNYLSRLITFHTVKASYITNREQFHTHRAWQQDYWPTNLGVDFEVRNVDVDFKTALLFEKGIDLSK